MCDDETQSIGGETSPGQKIGNYRILEKIGEGGMGEVWLAEQKEPLRRKVALKLIKSGMDTSRVVARFEAERQALALMDHPAIAKIYDGGATLDGRPFFVMEYIQGTPLTEYCDRKKANTRERLALFAQVCEGVQHAHRKAVIHRDLKPSNVLVTEIEGRACPKIIDFGVAKALSQPLTERTLHTDLGMLVGTIEYMSPEQADLESQDIDTRSDVYSLGVILYQLLVGTLPFESKELRGAGLEAMLRKIRQDEPARPSARLNTLETPQDTAEKRGVVPTVLYRQLSGDLDWITMKALEKEPERRYDSPQAIAADITAHLADRPVIARPPRWGYRIAKFLRRHRVAAGVTSLVLVMLLVLVGAMSWQARQLAEERRRAEKAAESAASTLNRLDSAGIYSDKTGVHFELDRIAPLGQGNRNAAQWFADFTKPDGSRLVEWDAAFNRAKRQRKIPSPELLPDDPLLLEAEQWVNQSEMRFYPDIWAADGPHTQIPNLLLFQKLARAWIARGNAAEDISVAMEDYRRALRLGRLLRQQDSLLITHSQGRACIRQALEAMERRLRKSGDEQQADIVKLALYDILLQRFQSAHLLNSMNIWPYSRVSLYRATIDVPDWKLEHIGRQAVNNQYRRIRLEAASTLCYVYRLGKTKKQKRRARAILDEAVQTGDPFVMSMARCDVNYYGRN